MSCRRMALGLVLGGLVTVLAAGTAFAQTPPAPGGGGAGGGGRARFNPMDNVKTTLAVTDEEWTVLQPKLQKVMDLNREIMMSRMAGMMRGRGGRGGPGGPGGPGGDTAAAAAPTNDVQEKTKALSDALDNKDSAPKDIAQKLAAVRDARERAKADLVKAQAELKELLTPKQEARLVLMGMLD
jgi:hypothetical protein